MVRSRARAEWFAHRLLESADAGGARAYLEKRDIALEVAAPHGLGYAPAVAPRSWTRCVASASRTRCWSSQASRCSGMTARIHARFRDRLLFPIHDIRGRAVGFGGRLLGPGEPKYLNSPETPIFHKGRQLYNLHHAKQAIRQEQVVIVVEGYFDVLRLVLAGIDHVVAPLGNGAHPGAGRAPQARRAGGDPAVRQRFRGASCHLPRRRRTAAARRAGARRHAPAGRGPRYHRAEGRRRRARPDPAGRHRRARAEDPRARPPRLVPRCGAPARGTRQAAAHGARGDRPDHPRALPGPRGGAFRSEPRCPGARAAVRPGERARHATGADCRA